MVTKTTPLAKKLQIKPGAKVHLIGAPEEFPALVGDLPEGARLVRRGRGPFDMVIAFVRSSGDVARRGPDAIARLRPGAVLWLCYPKGATRGSPVINRDQGWDYLKDAGWRPVTQVAVDEQWSALRFRPEAEVGS